MIGFLLLMNGSRNAPQVRHVLVVPEFRGMGLGKKRMGLYVEFLRRWGYQSSSRCTTYELAAVASLYMRHGFMFTEEGESQVLGKPLREQRYELLITPMRIRFVGPRLLQKRTTQDHGGKREIDNEARHVHECCHEGCR